MHLMRSSCKIKKSNVKDETHKNIYDEVNEYELYNLEKMILDEKE